MRWILLIFLASLQASAMVMIPGPPDLSQQLDPLIRKDILDRTAKYIVPMQRCLAFLIDKQWLLTAEHCIDTYNAPNVILHDGKKYWLSLELRYPDPSVDIALLRLKEPLEKDFPDRLAIFENDPKSTFFAIGNEWGAPSHVYEETKLRIGSIYSLRQDLEYDFGNIKQNTLTIEVSPGSPDFPMTGNFYPESGDSGGPLLNAKGQIVGDLSRGGPLTKENVSIETSHWSALSRDVVKWIRWVQKDFDNAHKTPGPVLTRAVKDHDWIIAATLVDPDKTTVIPYGPKQSMTIDKRGRLNTTITFSGLGGIKFYNEDVNKVIKHIILNSGAPVDEGGAFCSLFPCRQLRFPKSHDTVTIYSSEVPLLMRVFPP